MRRCRSDPLVPPASRTPASPSPPSALHSPAMNPLSRRDFLGATAVSAAALAFPQVLRSEGGPDAIQAEIVKRHGEGIARLQEWVRQPSIAAENRGMNEGCELMMRFAREAGFQQVTGVPSDGQPGVFATLDASAARTTGLYFTPDAKEYYH